MTQTLIKNQKINTINKRGRNSFTCCRASAMEDEEQGQMGLFEL